MNKLLTRCIALFLVFMLGSCTPATEGEDGGKPMFVTTTGMIADAVKHVAGDFAEVKAIMGPGVDPHLYKATKGDLDLMTSADIIFYNGLHLEGKMGEVLEKLGRTRPVVAVSDRVPRERLHRVPEYNNNYDPHIWFDLSLWRETLPVIAAELGTHYPEMKEQFMENSRRYQGELDSLHVWAKAKILEIPEPGRVLITAHDAFGYFGEAYGMEVKGLQGISTLSEFGLRDRVELVDLITSRQIKAVFVETSVPERALRAVVEGCRERGFEVSIGGYLYSDAMGEEGTPEGTFTGMFRANVNTITNALK